MDLWVLKRSLKDDKGFEMNLTELKGFKGILRDIKGF